MATGTIDKYGSCVFDPNRKPMIRLLLKDGTVVIRLVIGFTKYFLYTEDENFDFNVIEDFYLIEEPD